MIIRKVELDPILLNNGHIILNMDKLICEEILKVGYDKNGLFVWFTGFKILETDTLIKHKIIIYIINDICNDLLPDCALFKNSFLKNGNVYHVFWNYTN